MISQNIFPQAADFIVTDRCNLNCPVCWGSNMPSFTSLPIEMQERMLEILAENGVKIMAITGGEPLIEPHLPRLLKKANLDLGIKLVLFTNCIFLRGKEKEILPHISKISMSLDGYNEESNSLARKPGHFNVVLDTFRLLREKYTDKQVQVITVVTEKNKDFLEKIGNLLIKETRGLNFCWKLNYYFLIGKENSSFQLPYKEFENKAREIEKKFSSFFQVRYSKQDRDNAYLFVFPDGNLYTTHGKKYVSLGNVFNYELLKKIKERSSERRQKEKKII